MRNKISHRQLGRDSAHRQALFRNMIEALVTHGRIRTTLAKAKEVRRFADRVVTWGKLGGSVYHSKVHAFLRTPEAVKSVFDVLAPRYKDREGGYTRVLRCGFRKGDNATMAVLEYVDRDGELRPARPPRLRLEAEAAAAAGAPAAAPAAPPPSLEERLAAMVAAQGAVRSAVAAGAVPALTPAFPAPHAAPRAWSDEQWAPRSRAARAAIAAGGSASPLSRTRGGGGNAAGSAGGGGGGGGGSGSSSGGGENRQRGGGGGGSGGAAKEPELR